jgi:hypothetical protein
LEKYREKMGNVNAYGIGGDGMAIMVDGGCVIKKKFVKHQFLHREIS